jgi:hypothetical protein
VLEALLVVIQQDIEIKTKKLARPWDYRELTAEDDALVTLRRSIAFLKLFTNTNAFNSFTTFRA